MNFDLDETDLLVRDTARSYAQGSIAPRAAEIDREGTIPPAILKGLAALGLMGVSAPEAYGGAGAGTVAYSLALTEVARACASTAVTMAVTNMVGEVIARFGTEEQKRASIPRFCDGSFPGAFALSEVGAGSDPGGMATTATRDGDHWVINGTKQWISHGDTSGVLITWARTGGPGPKGLSCFLVPGDAPGLSVAGLEHKMGLLGSHTASLVYENVRLPADALLGDEGMGFRIAMMALDGGRIGIASQALGIAEAAQEAAIAYSKERAQFGKAIAEFQAIQWMLADSRVELDAMRLLALQAASLKQRGLPFTKEASMAKVFASEKAWAICNRAVQIHGGYGYTREFPVERHLRDVRVTQIYEGTSEVQRVVISRSLLRDA
ncbi:MAG: acyl-CoA dehydrogenase family protein [Myxococcales bacterium]|nr:acyl-CoA dehydrogenase family protein [Myxococcales bacterium]